MKITKSQLKKIIEETLEEGGFGGVASNLAAVTSRPQFQAGVDTPDSFLQRPSTPDSAIQGAAHAFFMKLGITDPDVCRTLVGNIAIPDLKEIMKLIPKLDTAQEEPPQ